MVDLTLFFGLVSLLGLSGRDGIILEELARSFHMNQSTIARALKKAGRS